MKNNEILNHSGSLFNAGGTQQFALEHQQINGTLTMARIPNVSFKRSNR